MPGKSAREKIVVVSGGFDPIHIGHVRMIQEAKKLGDKLIVILNNDNWLRNKKTHPFMNQKEREEILRSIDGVDDVVITSHPVKVTDTSVCRELLKIRPHVFANGGDRKNVDDIPEAKICRELGCDMVFNVGQGGKIQSSSWLLAKYVNKIKPSRKIDVDKIMGELTVALAYSHIKLPLELKLKAAKIMLKIMNQQKDIGLFVILGWDDKKWRKHTDIPDSVQDIYAKRAHNIMKAYKTQKHNIETTVNFDGAILVDPKGNIVHSGIIIEGLRPKMVADKINPGKFKDLSDQFGFIRKVHSRHLSAITASYIFKGTTIMTVSEETNSFHVFEAGKIIYRMYE